MTQLFRHIKSSAPYLLAIWIIIILIFSSLPRLPEAKIKTQSFEMKIDFILHFTEYLALAFLAILTFAKNASTLFSTRVLIVISCIVIFAALDESHQLLIPGRTFNIKDLASNFAGILSGSLITVLMNRKFGADNI